ncbi:hypothetical protein Smar_0370 [Staphylothermus marinus F1]|uniref:Uncharacterized protein n=1 Tax=Staphylothermus marinus (strain ATCC 43588 / DSM 3639 / JCM 9404 / F1) TaxID=399550 RepID=A3DLH2_STAMF|nr:hypothetical protein [Staphylothermus marinus]ABN69482.1 hypothetical protein Smar_0370 [Staphylothermus marinus F1]
MTIKSLIGFIDRDHFEIDEALVIGGIKSVYINTKYLTVIGFVNVKNLLVTKNLLVIGGGRIKKLVGENIILKTDDAPLIIDELKAKEAYLLGGKHPVIIYDALLFSTFLKHALINKLKAKKIIFSSRARVKVLADCDELYFIDPHTYIEEFQCKPSKYVFKYEVVEESK